MKKLGITALLIATALAVAWAHDSPRASSNLYFPAIYKLIFGTPDESDNVVFQKTAADTITVTGNITGTGNLNGFAMPAPGEIGATTPDAGTFTSVTGNNAVVGPKFTTLSVCFSSAAPAACGNSGSGGVLIAAGQTSVTVNTTQVTADSQIFVFEDSSLGTALSATCNTTLGRFYAVTARTAATSFVLTTDAAPVTNPACLSYWIVN